MPTLQGDLEQGIERLVCEAEVDGNKGMRLQFQ